MPLVAHRGQRCTLPENTLESVQKAIDCGTTAVEFDVQMTADHVPVVSHNMSLLLAAQVDLNIEELNFEELIRVHVDESMRFDGEHKAVSIPSLKEMVSLLRQHPEVTAFVELKEASIAYFGKKKFLKHIRKELEGAGEQFIVIADNIKALLKLREHLPIKIGWIIHNWDILNLRRASEANVDLMVIDKDRVAAIDYDFSSDTFNWMTYKTNDPTEAVGLFERGFDYVESDDICNMLEQIPDFR